MATAGAVFSPSNPDMGQGLQLLQRLSIPVAMVDPDPVLAPSARCDGRPPLPLATRAMVQPR